MGLEGYTGPTSGRITIKGDEVLKRETFHDRPLSLDERSAVEWFTILSPHEQLREVRRLKWNAEERLRTVEANRETIIAQDAEIMKLRAELVQRRPDRFEVPRAAADLLEFAERYGWKTVKAWMPVEIYDGDRGEYRTDPDAFRLEVKIGRGETQFDLSWACGPGGVGRMIRRGLARYHNGPWRDAPSLKGIKAYILADYREGLDDLR